MAVYAVSDLHGQFHTFETGLEKIGFGQKDQLYLIGDAIDRGPDGIRILQYIMDHENMDLIIGNHEFMMLNAVNLEGKDRCNGRDADLWLYHNGGAKTYEKYKALSNRERLDILQWLQDRYVIKTIDLNGEHFCLTHAYFQEEFEGLKYSEMRYDDIWKIVWCSPYRDDWETQRAEIYKFYDYVFITGHVPVQRLRATHQFQKFNELRVFEKDNFYDIDGGCAMGYVEELNNGALFLRLDDRKVFSVPLIN